MSFPQAKIDNDLEPAIQNAKKGIYWALTNLPMKKQRLDHDLISDDKLYSSVKIFREVNGFKIEATGFFNTVEVTLKVYRSLAGLKKEGYIKSIPQDMLLEEEGS
jgi:hypothetical protein